MSKICVVCEDERPDGSEVKVYDFCERCENTDLETLALMYEKREASRIREGKREASNE